MGFTVTTNLALIKPDDEESIKQDLPTYAGWASQNSDNCDKIDGLFRASTASPGLTFSAAGGGFTLGAGGFTEFKSLRFTPRMCIVFFRMYCGVAGFAAGTGAYQITGLTPDVDPILDAFANSGEIPLGKVIFLDNSAVLTSSVFLAIWNKTGNSVFFRNPDGNGWSATFPVALGQDDRVSGYFMYPTTDV